MIWAMFSMVFSSKVKGAAVPGGDLGSRVGWDRRVLQGQGTFDADGTLRDGPFHRVGGGQAERQTEGASDGDDQRRDEDAPHGVSPVTLRSSASPEGQMSSRMGVDDAPPSSRTTPRRR